MITNLMAYSINPRCDSVVNLLLVFENSSLALLFRNWYITACHKQALSISWEVVLSGKQWSWCALRAWPFPFIAQLPLPNIDDQPHVNLIWTLWTWFVIWLGSVLSWVSAWSVLPLSGWGLCTWCSSAFRKKILQLSALVRLLRLEPKWPPSDCPLDLWRVRILCTLEPLIQDSLLGEFWKTARFPPLTHNRRSLRLRPWLDESFYIRPCLLSSA